MKKFITVLLICLILLLFFLILKNAVFRNQTDDFPSAEEVELLRENLIAYEYGETDFAADVLFTMDHTPKYLFGATARGYVILKRSNGAFCECGEGNPYEGYMEEEKYYGGSGYLCKLRQEDNQIVFYDILRRTEVSYTMGFLGRLQRWWNKSVSFFEFIKFFFPRTK